MAINCSPQFVKNLHPTAPLTPPVATRLHGCTTTTPLQPNFFPPPSRRLRVRLVPLETNRTANPNINYNFHTFFLASPPLPSSLLPPLNPDASVIPPRLFDGELVLRLVRPPRLLRLEEGDAVWVGAGDPL